jgi:AcrR family transcriptional regulator
MTSHRNAREKPKPYHHGDLRNALVEAGLDLLATEGIAGFNLRRVAQQAGVSHAAPYRHFEDKQALIAAIAEEGFHKLVAHLQAAVDEAPDNAREQLHAMGLAYVRFALDNPDQLRLMFSGTEIERERYPSLYAASKRAFHLLTGLITRGQQAGTIVFGSLEEQALVVWSTIHGLAILLVENQFPGMSDNPAQVEGATRLAFDTLHEGLGPK